MENKWKDKKNKNKKKIKWRSKVMITITKIKTKLIFNTNCSLSFLVTSFTHTFSPTHTQRKWTYTHDNTLDMIKRFSPWSPIYIVLYSILISVEFVYSMWSFVRCDGNLSNSVFSVLCQVAFYFNIISLSLFLSLYLSFTLCCTFNFHIHRLNLGLHCALPGDPKPSRSWGWSWIDCLSMRCRAIE